MPKAILAGAVFAQESARGAHVIRPQGDGQPFLTMPDERVGHLVKIMVVGGIRDEYIDPPAIQLDDIHEMMRPDLEHSVFESVGV